MTASLRAAYVRASNDVAVPAGDRERYARLAIPVEHRNTRRVLRVKRVRQRDIVLASILAGVSSNVRKNGMGA